MPNRLKWPGSQKCDRCGSETADLVYRSDGTFCWDCHDGERQAQADRDYDDMREREMEGE